MALDSAFPFRSAPTLEIFLRRPIGRFWVGDQIMAWGASPSLIGVTFWGVPGSGALDAMLQTLDAAIPSDIVAPCNVVFDVRRVVSVDVPTFERLLQATQVRRAACERRIGRQVVVRPSGLVGALAEGFAGLFGLRYRWAVVDSLERAITWLDVAPMRGRLAAIDALVDETMAQSVSVARVRAWLLAHPQEHRIRTVAHALGCSTRTLQRALAAAGTSFKKESDTIRTAQAQHWLSRTTDKIDVIARQLGFMTSSSFASFFRRHTGASPRELQRTARGT